MGIKHLKQFFTDLNKNNYQIMGINNFNSVREFIEADKKRLFEEEVRENNITNPAKKMHIKNKYYKSPYVIGIDALLYAFKYKRVFERIEYGFYRQILESLSSGIIPVYIFDGNARLQKYNTIKQRQNKKKKNLDKLKNLIDNNTEILNKIKKIKDTSKQIDINSPDGNYLLFNKESNINKDIVKLLKKSITITKEDLENLKKFFDFLGIPYFTAINETDDLMPVLYKKGIINACQSDDMDMLPKGCGNVIQITSEGAVIQYLLEPLLDSLKLNYTQFVDLCILFGSEYCKIYLPITPLNLYEIFKEEENPSIEKFVESYSEKCTNIKALLDKYQKTRSLFLDSFEIFNEIIFTPNIKHIIFKSVKIYFLEQMGIVFGSKREANLKHLTNLANKFIMTLNNNCTNNRQSFGCYSNEQNE